MSRLPGYRRSPASKLQLEQALESKSLKPRDDLRIIPEGVTSTPLTLAQSGFWSIR